MSISSGQSVSVELSYIFKDTENARKSIIIKMKISLIWKIPFSKCHNQCHLLSSLLDFKWNLKGRHLTRDRVVFCMSTEKRPRIEKVGRANKCEQMCTKFREKRDLVSLRRFHAITLSHTQGSFQISKKVTLSYGWKQLGKQSKHLVVQEKIWWHWDRNMHDLIWLLWSGLNFLSD